MCFYCHSNKHIAGICATQKLSSGVGSMLESHVTDCFFSPALCACFQPLNLQYSFSQFLSEPLDLLQQDALSPTDVLKLRALLWAQVYWDWMDERGGMMSQSASEIRQSRLV